MMRSSLSCVLLIVLALSFSGCSVLKKRANVTALNQEQEAYYTRLEAMLARQKSILEDGLDAALQADQTRRVNLLQWQRDLAKAEILLKRSPTVTGDRELLLMKLTESDIASLGQFDAMYQIQIARRQKLLGLYSALLQATKALKENSKTLSKYLNSSDEKIAVTSLDVGGMVQVISLIRDLRSELEGLEQRSDEERKEQDERLQEQIDLVRDVLLELLDKEATQIQPRP